MFEALEVNAIEAGAAALGPDDRGLELVVEHVDVFEVDVRDPARALRVARRGIGAALVRQGRCAGTEKRSARAGSPPFALLRGGGALTHGDRSDATPQRAAGAPPALGYPCAMSHARASGCLCGASIVLLATACSSPSPGGKDAIVDLSRASDVLEVDLRRHADAGVRADGGAPASDLTGSADAGALPDLFADAALSCGNARREPGEQCDDGARAHLDGCSASCTFEQVVRVSSLRLQFGADETCPRNGLGAAFALPVRSLIQEAWARDIGTGRLNMLFHFLSVPDLAGEQSGPVALGVSFAQRVAGDGHDAAEELDWWYAVEPELLQPDRLPRQIVAAQLEDRELRCGPVTLPLRLNTAGSAAGPLTALELHDARLSAEIGSAEQLSASMGQPPGHLPAENLDPELRTFAGMGRPGLEAGRLCGTFSAAALRSAPAPALLAGTGVCLEEYGREASLLDVLVGAARARSLASHCARSSRTARLAAWRRSVRERPIG